MRKKSEWLNGLLYAEEMCKNGYRVVEFYIGGNYFSWELRDTPYFKNTVYYEDYQWLVGVRDYYKNKYDQLYTEFKIIHKPVSLTIEDFMKEQERLPNEMAQVIEDNFWDLVLK